MKIATHLLASALAASTLLAAAHRDAAASEEYIPKVQAKTLFQGPLAGAEGKEVIIKHFAIPAKYVGAKHIHPGATFVYVLEGELTIELESGVKTFKAGDLYPEEINMAMVGKNLSATDDLEILVFQVGDAGKPMMLKVQ